jgi:hypothetical protein
MPDIAPGLPGRSLGTNAISGGAYAAGFTPDQPGFLNAVVQPGINALNALPPWWRMAGLTAQRMSNALIYGGATGIENKAFAQNMPRAWMRYGNPNELMDNTLGGKEYSPFQLSTGINRSLEKHRARVANLTEEASEIASSGGKAELGAVEKAKIQLSEAKGTFSTVHGQMMDKIWGGVGKIPGIKTDGSMPLVEGGFYSKVVAGSRLSRMGDLAAVSARAGGFSRGGLLAEYEAASMSGREAATHYMASAFKSQLGQRAGGYLSGAMYGDAALSQAGMEVGGRTALGAESIFGEGAKSAVSRLATGNLTRSATGKLIYAAGEEGVEKVGFAALRAGVKEAAVGAAEKGAIRAGVEVGGTALLGSIGYAVPVLNVAMAAWTVYDLGKALGIIGGGAASKVAQAMKDSGKSLMGQINKPVFGMGFVDNEVAFTSRSRGVAAIQNSRLNARSILGSEAGPLAAHFG